MCWAWTARRKCKTARRKLAELAGRGQALEFSSKRWATEAPDALATCTSTAMCARSWLTLPKTHGVHAGDDRVLGERRERSRSVLERGTAGDDDAGAAPQIRTLARRG